MAFPNHHRYLAATGWSTTANPTGDFEELDEAEIWNANYQTKPKSNKVKPVNYSAHRQIKKPATTIDHRPLGPKSLPVNVPDWSKILQDEYRSHGGEFTDEDEDDEEEDANEKMPPHEYLAKTRVASFSVDEGFGRSLKVRNAIWKKIGMID